MNWIAELFEQWVDNLPAPEVFAAKQRQTTLVDQIDHWQTPATDSFRSRGGDRVDEKGLDQQCRLWATPMSRDTRSGETIADYGNARPLNEQVTQWLTPHGQSGHPDTKGKQGGSGGGEFSKQVNNWGSSPTDQQTPAGKNCWCNSPGCDLPTHRRKLNPIFETWLMGWRISWLTSVPVRSGHLEMESYLFRLRLRLRFYCGGS